jgi:hypothetical protein
MLKNTYIDLGYENYPKNFKTCIPYLLASIIYHENWLRSTLVSSHPIFTTRLFTDGHVERLRNSVLTDASMCPQSGLRVYGVPSHLVLANKMEVIQSKFEEFEVGVKRHLTNLENHIDSKLDALPTKLCDSFRSNFETEGALALTKEDVSSMFADFREEMKTCSKQIRRWTSRPLLKAILKRFQAAIFDSVVEMNVS